MTKLDELEVTARTYVNLTQQGVVWAAPELADHMIALIACIRELADAVKHWRENYSDTRAEVADAIIAKHLGGVE